jgi:hypothetical protein
MNFGTAALSLAANIKNAHRTISQVISNFHAARPMA